jgi:hypothetical protein
MALNGTMVKIETVTVGSGGAANIEFTNIPQTYTDLKVVLSARTNRASVNSDIYVEFNGNTSAIYSFRRLYGDGSAATSDSLTNNAKGGFVGVAAGANATASTFGNTEFYIPNYTGSTNKSFSGDGVNENNATSALSTLIAGLWANTSAITSIKILDYNSASFVQHSTATLYGISRTTAQIKATGGMVYDTDTHVYHLFNASGTFTPLQNLTVDYLVVAGGGGASMGGGGGGGLRSTVTATGGGGSLESALSLTANTNYTVTIGAGGAGGAHPGGSGGTNGGNSVFSTITATGGGGGGKGDQNGIAGGAGGGGGGNGSGTSTGGAGTANQGFAGGGNGGFTGSPFSGGGGGGAGAVGGNATANNIAGNGGNGVTVAITGSSVAYAGGGGGAMAQVNAGTVGTGGTGGGANGRSSDGVGTSASSNTGGGGGAASGSNTGGAGGSGVVIVRYAK